MNRAHIFSYDKVWNGKESRQGWADLREEVICLKGTTGYVCGTARHPSEVEVDHVTPRAWFKASQEADRMKHLQPICTSCHRAKTKSDLKVLRRMRCKPPVRGETGRMRKQAVRHCALSLPNTAEASAKVSSATQG